MLLRRSMVIATLVMSVTLLSGCSKGGFPTEKEVSEALKDAYATCVPYQEWEDRYDAKQKIVKENSGVGRCIRPWRHVGEWDWAACLEEKDRKIKEAQDEFTAWVDGRFRCNKLRMVNDDRFVSFKKTDGKQVGNEYQEYGIETAQEYKMYGIITRYNAEEDKNEDDDISLKFERRESGWVQQGFLFPNFSISIAR